VNHGRIYNAGGSDASTKILVHGTPTQMSPALSDLKCYVRSEGHKSVILVKCTGGWGRANLVECIRSALKG